MVSLQTLEVDFLILPAFVVFVLFTIPVPVVSKLLSRLILRIERLQVSGVSLLVVLTVGSLILFLNSFLRYSKQYGADNKFDLLNVKDLKPDRFHDLSLKVEYQGKKWKAERDMYIHCLGFVLLAAVTKIARLVRQGEDQAVKQKKE